MPFEGYERFDLLQSFFSTLSNHNPPLLARHAHEFIKFLGPIHDEARWANDDELLVSYVFAAKKIGMSFLSDRQLEKIIVGSTDDTNS